MERRVRRLLRQQNYRKLEKLVSQLVDRRAITAAELQQLRDEVEAQGVAEERRSAAAQDLVG